jgi:DNA-binding response OmpR family regulator
MMSESTEDGSRGVRVLLVDDDERMCRQMAAGLSHAGYSVVTAHDGTSAISQAADTPPDLAIVDLELPGSGLDVIRRLKSLRGDAVHVIVMTGHDDEARRRDAFEAGTNDFVVKPTGLAEIKRRLGAAVRTQQAFVEVRVAKEAADRRMTYGTEATALLAHDLNNSLAISLSNVQYAAESSGLNQDERDALAGAIGSLKRMSALVANFVDVARFEDAAVKPRVQRTRVATIIDSAHEIAAAVVANGVQFLIECDPQLEACFDAALIERVLHNLVGNAARYCNQGGHIEVQAHEGVGPDSLELVVRNTGPQVPETLAPSLFGKYERDAGGKRGMGLYFCRLVAEAHGGSIHYAPTPTGPSFIVRLPGLS